MTEEQIERRAERAMHRLDAQLIGGKITQAEYDREVQSLHRWTENAHKMRPVAYASSETAYGRTVAYPFAIKVF